MGNEMDHHERHMERIRERNYEQNIWAGLERRHPQFRWYRVMTDELRDLKMQVKTMAGFGKKVDHLQNTIYKLYEAIKKNGD